nr:TrbG/VirB9 family P-type conjugative transfer protein [Ancylobacter sp. FA202]
MRPLETLVAAPRDSRIRFVQFEPYSVVRIIGTLRSSVQVEFAPEEEIVHVATGNSIAWEVAPAGRILFLKFREKQVVTNLQVVTARRDGSKRSYQFELTVRERGGWSRLRHLFLAKFRYPGDEAEERRRIAAARAEVEKANQADKVLEFTMRSGRATGAARRRGRTLSGRRRSTRMAR